MVFQLESSNELLHLDLACKKQFFYRNFENGTLIQESVQFSLLFVK